MGVHRVHYDGRQRPFLLTLSATLRAIGILRILGLMGVAAAECTNWSEQHEAGQASRCVLHTAPGSARNCTRLSCRASFDHTLTPIKPYARCFSLCWSGKRCWLCGGRVERVCRSVRPSVALRKTWAVCALRHPCLLSSRKDRSYSLHCENT